MSLLKKVFLFFLLSILSLTTYLCFVWMTVTDISLEPINEHLTPELTDEAYHHRLPVTLISYADGDQLFYQNQNFLAYSALNKGIDQFILYRRNMLDPDFYEKNKDILTEKCGAGYWLWKPQIILQTMKNMPENAIIIYADTGFSFARNVEPLLKLLNKHDILIAEDGAKSPSPYLEKIVSPDLLKKFDIHLSPEEHITPLWAAFVAVKNTARAREFIERWLSFCEQKELIIQRFNDQALLGLLVYKYPTGVYTIPEPKISSLVKWHHRKPNTPYKGSLFTFALKHNSHLQIYFLYNPLATWAQKILLTSFENVEKRKPINNID